jgi:hypothetical protein
MENVSDFPTRWSLLRGRLPFPGSRREAKTAISDSLRFQALARSNMARHPYPARTPSLSRCPHAGWYWAIAGKCRTRMHRIFVRLHEETTGAWPGHVTVVATPKTGAKTSRLDCLSTEIAAVPCVNSCCTTRANNRGSPEDPPRGEWKQGPSELTWVLRSEMPWGRPSSS